MQRVVLVSGWATLKIQRPIGCLTLSNRDHL
jgi:hypothetical protein